MLIDAIELSSRTRTPEGFLRAPAVLTLVGAAEYDAGAVGVGEPGKRVRIRRTRETLSDAATLASLAAAPVVLDHPPGGVTAKNWRQHAVGHVVGMPRFDVDRVRADLLITDSAAIEKVERGVDELSVSYDVPLTPVGESDADYATGGPIRAEHIGVVDRGRARAGRDAKIADSLTGRKPRVTLPGTPGSDGGTDDMTADELKAAIKDALPAAIKDALPAALGKDEPRFDMSSLVTRLSDAITTAVVTPITDVVKRLTDAEEARQTAAALEDAKTKAAAFEKSIREEEQGKFAVLLDALPFVGLEKLATLRGKSSKEILVAALAGKVQDAEQRDESFLRGALAMLPKPTVTSVQLPPGSMPGSPVAHPQDASTSARDEYIKSLTGAGGGDKK